MHGFEYELEYGEKIIIHENFFLLFKLTLNKTQELIECHIYLP